MNLNPRARRPALPLLHRPLAGLLLLWMLLLSPVSMAQSQTPLATPSADAPDAGVVGGPVRLRQPVQPTTQQRVDQPQRRDPLQADTPPPAPTVLTDFEQYVRRQPGGDGVRRLGALLMDGMQRGDDGMDPNPLVPPDYLLGAGDVLVLTMWGSVDADLRLQVDRSGRISIPRVGPVMLSGVRYGDAPEVISRRVAQVFKNFQLSVSLAQLRGMRVYVTGFVNRPGAVSVTSLSTLAQAVARVGGPSASGSFRDIQLRRQGGAPVTFDLYELLLKGDRSRDQLLQPDDVIHIGPSGPQAAIIGSVNRPGIYELRAGETVDDVLAMAGGLNAVADSQRVVLERLGVSQAERTTQVPLPAGRSTRLANGDLLRALNASDMQRPIGLQNKRVRVDGEVARPGEYVLPPDSTLGDALRAAGGLTRNAYLYATVFTRESVRITQQVNYDRALRDFESQITSATVTRRASTPEEVTAQATASAASSRLLEQLRTLRPNGRIVLQLTPTTEALPDLVLEDGDRLTVPARSTTVGVFGSVFSAGSYLHAPGRTVQDYLRLAGGPTRGADDGSVFVIRANGSVNSSLQESGFFSRGNQISGLVSEPGDTIFVPEELNKTTWIQNAKDWTQILYQLGIGLAGMKSAVQ